MGMLALSYGCGSETDQSSVSPSPLTIDLIATQVNKELIVSYKNQIIFEPETLNVGGETFRLTTTKKSTFSYDDQGRITSEFNVYPAGVVDTIRYEYSNNRVTINTTTKTAREVIQRMQIEPLNNQGFSPSRPFSSTATYDNNGYLLSLKNEAVTATKIVNGNILESVFIPSASTPSFITTSQFDTAKLGLPPIRRFYGRDYRNLLVKSIIDQKTGSFITPSVYTSSYTYLFDQKGRVTRQTMRGKDGAIPFLYGGDLAEVNDFTYK